MQNIGYIVVLQKNNIRNTVQLRWDGEGFIIILKNGGNKKLLFGGTKKGNFVAKTESH